jgi:large subunit ribosomal protein L10
MERAQKDELVRELRTRFDRMTSAVFLDFTGMTVEEVTKLRDTFRARGVEYKVVKNTLVQKALADKPWVSRLDDVLAGMTGVAWSFEEPSAAARVLKDFCKENEKLKIKAGLLEGEVLNGKAVEEQLATLPNKDEARARLLATLMAPLQHFVMLLNAPAQNFVGVLAARQRKEEGSAG